MAVLHIMIHIGWQLNMVNFVGTYTRLLTTFMIKGVEPLLG